MAFFKMTKIIMHACALYVYDDSIRFFIYVRFLVSVSFMFTLFVTSFHYVLFNLDNIQKASTALFAANIMCIGSIYYTMIFIQRDKSYALIHEMEDIVNRRKFNLKCYLL